jgi:cyclopropane-fatty-acyl-phospholipid synthase
MTNAFAAGEKGRYMALAEVFETIAGPDAPVEFQAYDGSTAGTPGSPVKITVRSPVAVSYLAQAPGALGLARAYVSGHLDVHGDMFTALARLSKAQETRIGWPERFRLLQALGGPKVLLPRIPPPPQEVRVNRRLLNGRMHSKGRDANAISHHYDVSNRFYEWVLGPSMAYTCACFPKPDATLEEAQEYKFDLVARKLGLKAGMRLLDVGCGWGGMVMHAAREYGVKALGVTLSEQQALWAQQAIKRATWTTGMWRRPNSTRSARSGSPSTSASRTFRATSASSTESSRSAVECSTTALRDPTTPCRRSRRKASSTGTCSPTVSSKAPDG